jgi:hypothetical protein
MSPRRIVTHEVLCHFSKLKDPRLTVNRKHVLARVIVIGLLGVLAGVSDSTGIATWPAIHADVLRTLVPLPNSVPRKDVFRRLFCALKLGIFPAFFSEWIETLREAAAAGTGEDRSVLAVDCKTLRRSHDRPNALKSCTRFLFGRVSTAFTWPSPWKKCQDVFRPVLRIMCSKPEGAPDPGSH